MPLNEWVGDFVEVEVREDDDDDDGGDDDDDDHDDDDGGSVWVDIVEDFVPAP